MRISIITVCFNSEKTIEDAIQSVLSQTHKDIEYIIIDGASTDGTLKIINKYKGRIAKIVSEKDRGVYDAMNKGLSLATGEVIGFINSDDFYPNSSVIQTVADAFLASQADAVYGDLVFVEKNNSLKELVYWRPGKYALWKVRWGWFLPHPALFLKRKLYEKYGFFRTDFKIAADYELALRLFLKAGLQPYYVPQVLAYMRLGGVSTQLKNQSKSWQEVCRALKINGLRLPAFSLIPFRIFWAVVGRFEVRK